MAEWSDLRRAIVNSPSRRRLTAGEAELDAFEARHGFKLPASYRSFVKQFGRCELSPGAWKIAAPGVVAADDYLDLDRLVEEMSEVVAMDVEGIPGQEPSDRELALRMIFFAMDVGGDYYGWDRGEVTESAPEYAVYARTPTYERVASSFAEFLLSYALGDELARWKREGEPGAEMKFDEPSEDPRIFLEPM